MAQLKIKQISDFVTGVEAKINALVGTATGTAISDAKSDAIAAAESKDVLRAATAVVNISTAKTEAISAAVSADVVVLSQAKAHSDIQKGRIDTLLEGKDAALDTFKEISDFITSLETSDVAGLSTALSTAVSNDAVHASGISANSTAIANLDFGMDLSLEEPTESTNTVTNTNGTGVTLNGATAEFAGLMTANDFSKLEGIEALADVTDSVNVRSAGALMEGDITNLAQVKAFDKLNYDASGSAATAEANANAFTNQVIIGLSFGDIITKNSVDFDLSGSAANAEINANNRTDGFISALGTAAYSATGAFATAAQGALADSALQNASAFDASGSAATAKSEAIAAAALDATSKADAAETDAIASAKTYTDTRETSILSTLRGEISAVAGVDKVEQIAALVDGSVTEFSVTTPLSLANNDILVFVNGLQIHKSSEVIDGFATADGRTFVISGLGYTLEATDHIVVVGVEA
jgi:hypothetical protein